MSPGIYQSGPVSFALVSNPSGLVPGTRVPPNTYQLGMGAVFGVIQPDLTTVWYDSTNQPLGQLPALAPPAATPPAALLPTVLLPAAPAPQTNTQTVVTIAAMPKAASNDTQPTTATTIPADTRGTGYGTIPPAAGAPKLDFSTGGVPLSAVPPGTPFVLTISGAPAGAPIQVDSFGSTNVLGTADLTGRLVIAGSIPAGPSGAWHEEYSVVGNAPFATLDFNVLTPGGAQTGAPAAAPSINLLWVGLIVVGVIVLMRS